MTRARKRPCTTRSLRHIPIELVHANPNNPRKHFDEEDLEELAASIRDKGLLQPSWCANAPTANMRSSPANGAGGRRSGPAFTRCRCLIRELSDGEALEIALIENIQRADLNALEEARGYEQLLNQFTRR